MGLGIEQESRARAQHYPAVSSITNTTMSTIPPGIAFIGQGKVQRMLIRLDKYH